jgi:CubicO group peptidase (beta-lactamase class C family)
MAPGVAVALLERGEVRLARGFGSKHPERNDPVRPTTLFRIGSVTKMMTAAALLQLAASGKVDLEKPITDYVPDYKMRDPAWAPSIKVGHLLKHTTSIYDYVQINWEDRDDGALSGYLTDPMGPFARQVFLMATAGRMWNYANPNFMLAGLVVERVGQLPYRLYMRDKLFLPLGMKRTFFVPDDVNRDGDFAYARSRDRRTGAPIVVRPDSYENVWGRPAGFAFSSVLDLALFVRFLLMGNDAVLPRERVQAMQSPQVNTETAADLVHYGYGLIVSEAVFLEPGDFRRARLVSHGGAIDGFAANVMWVPATGFAIITLANTDGAYFSRSEALALKMFGGLPAPSDPPMDLAERPENYPRYAGAYNDRYNAGPVKITSQEGKLLIEMPLLDMNRIPYEKELRPVSRRNFILTVQGFPLPVTFILDDRGQVEYLRTRVFVARREAGMMAVPSRRLAPDMFRPRQDEPKWPLWQGGRDGPP